MQRVRRRNHQTYVGAALACAWLGSSAPATAQQSTISATYAETVNRIVAEATTEASASASWSRLAELTDKFPARLSGSRNLEGAIDWASAQMARDDLESPRVERVMVPHWVRGFESAEIVVSPDPQSLVIAALGGSVGTQVSGLQADVLVVKSFEELDAQALQARGRIVLFNALFRTDRDPLVSYRETVRYRTSGASRAAVHGAVAVLVRSVGPIGHRTVHTGALSYAAGAPQIPAAAIAAEDADKLQRMQDRGERVIISIKLGASRLPDAPSGNVIAELRGREKPDEIVLVGAHLDSWDLSSGAMDDGGGCIATWEALRLLKKLGLTPRRTIRLVLFTDEEFGGAGGDSYRDKHANELSKHVLMLESDTGTLPIKGWGFRGTPAARGLIGQIAALLKGINASEVSDRFDGADIEPSVERGVPGISPEMDLSRYFDVHHTPADTVDKISPNDLSHLVAAIASMAYVVADLPDPLPRN